MKKIVLCLVAVLFSAVALTACGGEAASISDYAVFKPDTVYRYEGTGSPLASQTIFNDYIHADEGLYQRRILAGNMRVGECILVENGEMLSYLSLQPFNFFYDLTKMESNGSARVLQEPLTKGASWIRAQGQTEAGEPYNIMAEITGENVEVTVPYGTFKALEVTVAIPDSEAYTLEYYVKDIGLIKKLQHVETPDETSGELVFIDLISELSAIEENTAYSDTAYLFYPDFAANDVTYETTDFSHHTDEDPAKALESLLQSYPTVFGGQLVGADTVVNSVELIYNEGKIKADFSEGLETAFAQDPATEELYIKALTNTVGYYFDVRQVLITVNGEGYQGNITLSADEYREVDASISVSNKQ